MMHAVILAGGKGVRLRPFTTSLPKPLMPIGNQYSILEIVLSQLSAQGFARVTLAIGHLGHIIRSFVGDGSRWGLQVDYVEEDTPLGTIGPLLHVLDRLPENVLVMNGDVLTDLHYSDLLRRHVRDGAPLTIATHEREVRIDFGVLDVDVDAAHVVGFREKPILRYRVSMGVYAITTSALRRYRVGEPFGFDDLVLDLLARGTRPSSFGFDGYWLDIGRPDDYDRANLEFERLRELLLPPDRVEGRDRVIVLPDTDPSGLGLVGSPSKAS
jgi:NDP-sugar pyrophosphorylase family protein